MSTASPERLFVLFVFVALAAGCSSTRRSFDPPLMVEDQAVRVEVNQAQHKGGHLRVWLTCNTTLATR